MGRFDNQKIGYFTNPLLSFSDAQQRTDKKQFITRWRMEPKPEDREAYLKGKVVEPAKPIVFYIDNSTPYQWRKYIKRGIEDWQIAFEKAGFKNAIIAIEVTDSMEIDMDDVNYSVLTYRSFRKEECDGTFFVRPPFRRDSGSRHHVVAQCALYGKRMDYSTDRNCLPGSTQRAVAGFTIG